MHSEIIDDEIDLLDYWDVIWRRKKLIISLFLISVLTALIVSLLLPRYYKATTTIIATGSEAGGLGTALSALPLAGALAGAAGIQTPADRVMVVLKSRTTAEAVIKRYDLLKVFNESEWDSKNDAWKDPEKPPFMEDAVEKLTADITSFSKTKEGAVIVAVEWKDPRLAADIVNYYIAALTGFLNRKAINITIQVIDVAVPAEKKSRPRTGLNIALAGVLSLFCGLFIAFFVEYLAKARSERMQKKPGDEA